MEECARRLGFRPHAELTREEVASLVGYLTRFEATYGKLESGFNSADYWWKQDGTKWTPFNINPVLA